MLKTPTIKFGNAKAFGLANPSSESGERLIYVIDIGMTPVQHCAKRTSSNLWKFSLFSEVRGAPNSIWCIVYLLNIMLYKLDYTIIHDTNSTREVNSQGFI